MRKMALRLLLVLSLGMNVGVLGMAVYRGRAAQASPENPAAGMSLREELRLTPEQASAFAALRGRLHPRVQALRQRMHERRSEFFELLNAPTPDSVAIERLLSDMNGIQLEMERAAAGYLLAQARLLTPEQRVAFARLMAQGPQEAPRQLPLLGPGGARLPDERR